MRRKSLFGKVHEDENDMQQEDGEKIFNLQFIKLAFLLLFLF